MRIYFIFAIFQMFAWTSAAQTTNSPPQIKRILVLGDSLSEGFGVSQKEAFPAQLEVLLLQKKYAVKIINAGSSGSTSASAMGRIKWHLKAKPFLIVLALGGNDGLRGINLEATEKNLGQTIELAQKNGIKVLLAGMKLPYNYGKDYRTQFERLFNSLVKKYKTGYVPFLLKGVGGVKSLNLPDGIHPNEQGHRKIAENLVPFIEAYL